MLQITSGKCHMNALFVSLANGRKLRTLTVSSEPKLHFTL